ncbi:MULTISPECIES: sialate O-acetylesterase [unclassified Sphingobium]|jgi:sialate O-acetylesterase|uniref:sialate O-acetylesterase n=1 Tax=Sphingobium TaxID=165695 RepID=UPI0010F726EE|nr:MULTISPECIES: sialate O-acetylesterase [unclassified Sphingobium]UXC92820.1 9-O-acetylesterase [Sphingobium sp. RSMS]
MFSRNIIWHLGSTVSLVALSAAPALAAPRFDPMFGDHAVIQRDHPVTVTGRADPGEAVSVTLAGEVRQVRADGEGRFAAQFGPLATAGPVTLEARAPSGSAVAQDVAVGDVFLCSGQSNMELEVRNAQDAVGQIRASADDRLRLMLVPRAVADDPLRDFRQAPSWRPAGPDSVADFSAACYYMARELRKTAGVPIGAIASSWGGSRISPWMGARAQAAVGQAAQSALVSLHGRDPFAAERAASAEWEKWWRKETGDAAGKEPWQPDSSIAWQDVPSIGPWEQWGVPALADYNGMVWFRREIELTAAQAKQAATLSLGLLDDVGRVWINGKPVAMSARSWQPSMFDLPPGVLKPGRNVLIVNVQDNYANGGLSGPADVMKLGLGQGQGGDLPLGDGWRYAVPARSPAGAPRVPWGDTTGSGTLYNGMIAPLGSIGLKGVAWYQGESDVDLPGYADRMKAMMEDWRRQFGSPDLAFVAVQLAAYGAPVTQPGESGWAAMRQVQYQAMARDAHGGLATAIDLGDPFDIHPGEKQEVGRRLARAMRAVAYGDPVSRTGPQAARAVATTDGGAAVEFTGLTGGLHMRSASQAIGFELCGAAAGSCRFVPGRVEGTRIVLAGDGLPATRVRYAWAESPVVNLYDEAPLPVGSFELPITR